MLDLYHSPFSTCSQKVRLCLAEKRLKFRSCVIDFGKLEHLSDGYLKLNPNGVVPTLLHDGHAVVDSSVICEYIDEVWRDNPLTPDGATARADMRAWMRYFEEVPTAAIRVPSFNMLFATSIASMPSEAFESMTNRMPLRKAFYRKLRGEEGFSQNLYDESIDKLNGTLERIEPTLQEQPWICGEAFSIADIVLIPTIVRMADIALGDLWADKPGISRWFEAAQQRDSFDTAFYPGCRIDPATYNLNMAT